MSDSKDSDALAETQAPSPGLAATVSDDGTPTAVVDVQKVDRYVIKRRLGAGGMGVVYEATDPELGRDVAIKMLRRGAPAERLRKEAQALARLDHPNVVSVYDVGEHDGQVFVAMALVDGTNLREWLGNEHTTDEVMRVLRGAAKGIIAAHDAGMVHRDLKPDNIFIARDGDVLVGDFGLATESDDVDGGGAPIGPAISLTQTGHVLGTPAYMAPEQAAGEASAKSDQFSFCVTAYEALYGTRPFTGASFDEILDKVESGEITQPRRARRVPMPIAKAIRRGLRAKPDERFPSMNDLVAAMSARATRRRWPFVAGGVAALGIIGAIAFALVGRSGDPQAACAPTRELFSRAWNPTIRTVLSSVLMTRGVRETATATVLRQLDEYAARWNEHRFAACLAEREEKIAPSEATARVDCLEVDRVSFEALLATIAQYPAIDFASTSTRIAELPALDACESTDAVRLAVHGGQHQALIGELVALEWTQALDGYGSLRERAERAGDLPAQLAISLAEGRRALGASDYLRAETALQRALLLGERLDASGARAKALALLARSRCENARDPAEYLALADAAVARLDEHHHGIELETVLEARGRCLVQSAPERAVAALEELVDRRVRRTEPDSLVPMDARGMLALAYRALGRIDDAKRQEAIVAKATIELAGDRIAAANDVSLAAHSAFIEADLPKSIVLQRRAADLWAGAFGNELLHARALSSLAMMYEITLAWRDAADTHGEVLALTATIPKTLDVEQMRAEAFAFRGSTRLNMSDFEGATRDFELGLPLATERDLTEIIAVCQLGLGRAWFARNEPQRALRYLREGLATHAKLGEAAAFRVGVAQFTLAQAQWQLGDKAGARETARGAEVSETKGLEQTRESKHGSFSLAYRQAQLDELVRWREEHR